jgi:hypothetical protein
MRLSKALLRGSKEALIDICALFALINCPRFLSGEPSPGWLIQVGILVSLAFFLPATPPAQEEGKWKRYRRLLPAFMITAVGVVTTEIVWLDVPAWHPLLVPLWLALTALRRLELGPWARELQATLSRRQIHYFFADLLWVAFFSYAIPRWAQIPGPAASGLTTLLVTWIVLNSFTDFHNPAKGSAQAALIATPVILSATWALLIFLAGEGGIVTSLVFSIWLTIALISTRLALKRWANPITAGSFEAYRWMGLFCFVAYLFHNFAAPVVRGTGDASYYATFLSDTLSQFRHAVFPVFVGQSEFQFNGAIVPIRVAPAFQYFGGVIDLLTARTLEPYAIQNLLLTICGFFTTFLTYFSLKKVSQRGDIAWFLTILFVCCPGVLALVFSADLYMSWLAAAFAPAILCICALTFSSKGKKLYATLGLLLGATWWMHPPIACWLLLVACAIQVLRFIQLRPTKPQWVKECSVGSICFILAALYPLVSSALYPANPALGAGGGTGTPQSSHMLQSLRDTFPGSILPVSPNGRLLSDFQLGYGLLALALIAFRISFRQAVLYPKLLSAAIIGLLLLLVPIPWVTDFLWTIVPAPVRLLTNTWPMQRLYLIVAALVVTLAATLSSKKGWSRYLLVAACAWSAIEATKFINGARASNVATSPVKVVPLSENVTLTRYSYGMFGEWPAYFTHGVTDPLLENRLLDADLATITESNYRAAIRTGQKGETTTGSFEGPFNALTLHPPIVLQPNQRYLAELMVPGGRALKGALVAKGTTFNRIYGLPEYGGSKSFGLGGDHLPFFPLHTSSNNPEPITFTLILESAADLEALHAPIRLKLTGYRADALPIHVSSWIPYRAVIQTSHAAWLETPRLFQQGYEATVNGVEVDVVRSKEGLVAIPLRHGESTVELTYHAPIGLRLAFWLSFSAILAGIAYALLEFAQQVRVRPILPDSPPAADR